MADFLAKNIEGFKIDEDLLWPRIALDCIHPSWYKIFSHPTLVEKLVAAPNSHESIILYALEELKLPKEVEMDQSGSIWPALDHDQWASLIKHLGICCFQERIRNANLKTEQLILIEQIGRDGVLFALKTAPFMLKSWQQLIDRLTIKNADSFDIRSLKSHVMETGSLCIRIALKNASQKERLMLALRYDIASSLFLLMPSSDLPYVEDETISQINLLVKKLVRRSK